jgi:hypothetical protein
MIEIRGEAEVLTTSGDIVGRGLDPEMFRIPPKRIVSIGLEGETPFRLHARSMP